MSELRKLSALTQMSVLFDHGSTTAFEVSFKGLAAVTQLRNLTVALDSQDLTVEGMLPLASLTALTALQIKSKDYSYGRPRPPWEPRYLSEQVSTWMGACGVHADSMEHAHAGCSAHNLSQLVEGLRQLDPTQPVSLSIVQGCCAASCAP